MPQKLSALARLGIRLNFLTFGSCLPVALVASHVGVTTARVYQVVDGLPAGIGDPEAVRVHDQELRDRYQLEARRPHLTDQEWQVVLFEGRREAFKQSRAITYRIVASEVERTIGGGHAA